MATREGEDDVSRTEDDGGTPRVRSASAKKVFAMLAAPFFLLLVTGVWILGFSDWAKEFRDVAADERSQVTRYAIEHTPDGFAPHLLRASGKLPAKWDRREVEAVLDLVERAKWPDPPREDVTNEGLLSRPPTEWTVEEELSVAELLVRFRNFTTGVR
ncbi:MAG: hypothetical protein R3F34_06485 [Planctomycetota bacterium]